MQSRSRHDDRVMTLVEEALSRPESQRESFLREACGSNADLFAEAWSYIAWEKRMQGFLLDPLPPLLDHKPPFEQEQVLINRFQLVREVGEGGMAVVWEAFDKKLNKRVALKCPKSGFGNQLPPEVRNAREISHPNVCKTFDIHSVSTFHGEIDFISMEFLEGETLFDRLRRAPLKKGEACSIAQQLCAGLTEAHRNGLIHGDLKTNNVILTTDSGGLVRAVITDFGLARRADAAGGALGGTRAYMAPELFKGGRPSVASDLYALGVMLWEIHTRERADSLGFASSTVLLGEEPHWKPPRGRGRWERIIARCIDPDPARRFKSATEVATAFGLSRRQKQILTVVAALVLVVITGLIASLIPPPPAETVQLALVPFASAPDNVSVAGTLLRNTAKELAELKSTPHTRFRFISLDKAIRHRVNTPEEARVLLGATHALRATVERHGENVKVHAYLTDLRSGVDARDWTKEYKRGEVRYAPTNLAAVVTEMLHLPPPLMHSTINAAARQDYFAGLKAVRSDRTVEEALDHFERAVKADPSSAIALAGLAEAQWFKFVKTDKLWLKLMAESVQKAQLRNPDLPQVHQVTGLLKFREGSYEQAIEHYLRAIELDPNNGDAYRRLGEAYERNGRMEKALTAFKRAIKTDARQYRNYLYFGNFKFKQARYEEAIEQFRKAVELAPNEPVAHYILCVTYQNTGKFALAEKEVRTSLMLNETSAALHTFGVILMYQRRDREAVPNIVRALQLGREKSLWWMNLGTAYRRLGLISDSAYAYSRGLELAEVELTNNPQNALLRTQLAYLCTQQNHRGRASSEIAQALKQAPNDADVLFMAAITYEALSRRDDTLDLLAVSPPGVLEDLNRWPDVANLHTDPHFLQLLRDHEK